MRPGLMEDFFGGRGLVGSKAFKFYIFIYSFLNISLELSGTFLRWVTFIRDLVKCFRKMFQGADAPADLDLQLVTNETLIHLCIRMSLFSYPC